VQNNQEPELTKEQQQLRWKNRRRMAWGSFYAMLVTMAVLLSPLVSEPKITVIESIVVAFFWTLGAIIGLYIGFATADSKWKK